MLETLFSGGQNHAVKLITIAGKDNCGHDNGACKQNLCTEGRSHIIYIEVLLERREQVEWLVAQRLPKRYMLPLHMKQTIV